MNILAIKKIMVSFLMSTFLVLCLFTTPNYPHVDQTPLFEKQHSHEIIEVEQFGDIQETNLNITRDKKRFVHMTLITSKQIIQ